jgi:hypothetical protein
LNPVGHAFGEPLYSKHSVDGFSDALTLEAPATSEIRVRVHRPDEWNRQRDAGAVRWADDRFVK